MNQELYEIQIRELEIAHLKAKVEIQQAIARKEQSIISRVTPALQAVIGVVAAFAGALVFFQSTIFQSDRDSQKGEGGLSEPRATEIRYDSDQIGTKANLSKGIKFISADTVVVEKMEFVLKDYALRLKPYDWTDEHVLGHFRSMRNHRGQVSRLLMEQELEKATSAFRLSDGGFVLLDSMLSESNSNKGTWTVQVVRGVLDSVVVDVKLPPNVRLVAEEINANFLDSALAYGDFKNIVQSIQGERVKLVFRKSNNIGGSILHFELVETPFDGVFEFEKRFIRSSSAAESR